MEHRRSDLMRSARLTMEACLVKPEETVVIYTDTNKLRATVDAFFGEAVAVGADVSLVVSPTRRVLENPSVAAVEAMKAADIVFDLASWRIRSFFGVTAGPERSLVQQGAAIKM